jgi:hypothetical protein
MKDLKHIKRFNESDENSNISDVGSDKSHIDFLDEFVEKINQLRDDVKKKGYVDNEDVDFIEDLYFVYSFHYDTEERFVKN